VDDATGEHFLFGRLALTFEEAAWNAPGRVGVLSVIDRQGKEVDAFTSVGGSTRRDEHDRIAVADHDGSARLLGKFPGLEPHGALADDEFARSHDKASRFKSEV